MSGINVGDSFRFTYMTTPTRIVDHLVKRVGDGTVTCWVSAFDGRLRTWGQIETMSVDEYLARRGRADGTVWPD